MKVYPKNTGALCAKMDRGLSGQDGFNDMIPVIERGTHDLLDKAISLSISEGGGQSSALKQRDYKDFTDVIQEETMERKYVLRRLTPLECARLQGFPDWWTDGVEGSDSAKYKMWGNGIALPCAADVIGRIAKEIRRNEL